MDNSNSTFTLETLVQKFLESTATYSAYIPQVTGIKTDDLIALGLMGGFVSYYGAQQYKRHRNKKERARQKKRRTDAEKAAELQRAILWKSVSPLFRDLDTAMREQRDLSRTIHDATFRRQRLLEVNQPPFVYRLDDQLYFLRDIWDQGLPQNLTDDAKDSRFYDAQIELVYGLERWLSGQGRRPNYHATRGFIDALVRRAGISSFASRKRSGYASFSLPIWTTYPTDVSWDNIYHAMQNADFVLHFETEVPLPRGSNRRDIVINNTNIVIELDGIQHTRGTQRHNDTVTDSHAKDNGVYVFRLESRHFTGLHSRNSGSRNAAMTQNRWELIKPILHFALTQQTVHNYSMSMESIIRAQCELAEMINKLIKRHIEVTDVSERASVALKKHGLKQ